MTAIDLDNDRLLKIAEVSHRTGLAQSTIYKKMDQEGFPRPVKLGSRTCRWWQSAVVGWLEEQTSAQRPTAAS